MGDIYSKSGFELKIINTSYMYKKKEEVKSYYKKKLEPSQCLHLMKGA